MPLKRKHPSEHFRQQQAFYQELIKSHKKSPAVKRAIEALPRPGSKKGKIKKQIEDYGLLGKEHVWVKNPTTGKLMIVPRKKRKPGQSYVSVNIAPKVLRENAAKYAMMVHPHPAGKKKVYSAGPSEPDIKTIMKYDFRSAAITILDSEARTIGTVMIKKTKEALEADEEKKKALAKKLHHKIKDLLYWDINRNLGSYEYRRQLALDKIIRDGPKEFGFTVKVFPEKGYKVVNHKEHGVTIEKKK